MEQPRSHIGSSASPGDVFFALELLGLRWLGFAVSILQAATLPSVWWRSGLKWLLNHLLPAQEHGSRGLCFFCKCKFSSNTFVASNSFVLLSIVASIVASICLSICFYRFIYRFIYRFMYRFNCRFVFASICLSICFYLCIQLSIYLSIYFSILFMYMHIPLL